MQFGIHQQAFMLFFAIFWGAGANVQPRWKAFQFPLVFKLGNVFRRVLVAFVLLNLAPIVYFGVVLWCIHDRGPTQADSASMAIVKVLVQGIIPAFGVFGLYRIWLALIELWPSYFYKADPLDLPEKYRHVEPPYRLKPDTPLCIPISRG